MEQYSTKIVGENCLHLDSEQQELFQDKGDEQEQHGGRVSKHYH